jgi:hypothetical protein
MRQENNDQRNSGRHEHPLAGEISKEQKKINVAAREEAEEDISEDADMQPDTKAADLDEGELARLGEDKPDMV